MKTAKRRRNYRAWAIGSVIVAAIWLLLLASARAEAEATPAKLSVPGTHVTISGFCTDEDSARALARAITSGGLSGYTDALDSHDISCFLSGRHAVAGRLVPPLVIVTDGRIVFTAVDPAGVTVAFWRGVTFGGGLDVYTWLPLSGKGT